MRTPHERHTPPAGPARIVHTSGVIAVLRAHSARSYAQVVDILADNGVRAIDMSEVRSLTDLLARTAPELEVDSGDGRRAQYAYDASNYRVPPLAVAFPRSADEVVADNLTRRTEGRPLHNTVDKEHGYVRGDCVGAFGS